MYTFFPQYLAQIINPRLSANITALAPYGFINRIIASLIIIALVLGVIIFLFMLITGGIRWITSSGDKVALEDARKKITHALIGLVILFSIWALIQLINLFFGIDIGNIGVPEFQPTPAPITLDCRTVGGSCGCPCPAGYSEIEGCNLACSGQCTCAPDSRLPTVTPITPISSPRPICYPDSVAPGVLNIATGLSCDEICGGLGETCQFISMAQCATHPSGYRRGNWMGVSCANYGLGDCSTDMIDSGNADPSIPSRNCDWTYCYCTDSALTPTPTPYCTALGHECMSVAECTDAGGAIIAPFCNWPDVCCIIIEGPTPTPTNTPTPIPEGCVSAYGSCANDGQCCTGDCAGGVCQCSTDSGSCLDDADCCPGLTCSGFDQTCRPLL